MFYLCSIFSFIFGSSVGSFLNCLIYRLYQHKNILDRSFCPKCQHQLSWLDLIPVFSFLALRGRCHYCRQKISLQYPLVELATGLLFLLSFLNLYFKFYVLNSTFHFFLIRDWFFISAMVFVFIYDLKYMLIEDIIVIPAIVAVFFLNLLSGYQFSAVLIGGIMGWLFFWLQYYLTKKKGLGEGDLRLGILMGVMFGWPNVLIAIFISYIVGGFVSLVLIIVGKKKLFSEVPLGPFLAIGSVIAMFFGPGIIDFYFNLFL